MAKKSFRQPPPWLPAVGKDLWKSIVGWMGSQLQPEDWVILGELCDAYTVLRAASAKVAELGVLVPGRRESELIANPACRVAAAARQQVAMLSVRLGLDPKSRSKTPVEQPDELDAFLEKTP